MKSKFFNKSKQKKKKNIFSYFAVQLQGNISGNNKGFL